jgi:hypothetical protein
MRHEWDKYRADVVPNDAGVNQVQQTQDAFYGGALALYELVMESLDPSPNPTEQDCDFISRLKGELMEYGISRGYKTGHS